MIYKTQGFCQRKRSLEELFDADRYQLKWHLIYPNLNGTIDF